MSRPNKLLLVLSFVGFIALGLPDAVIGVVWPALRTHFGLHQDALGPLFITVTVGSVMASTASGAILSRLGIGELLAFSCALTALALFGYTIAPSWIVLVSLGLLTGFGAGAIDAAINTHAATRYSARLVNVLHAFYGVGAAAGPALMTAVLTTGRPWQLGYRIIVVVEIVLAVAFILSRRQWPPPVATHEEHQRPARLAETLQLGKVQLSLLVFLIYTGCEAAAGAWVFSLLYEARDIATASAGTAVTLYWGGLFASRLGYAFLPSNVNPESIVKLCMITALGGRGDSDARPASARGHSGHRIDGLCRRPHLPIVDCYDACTRRAATHGEHCWAASIYGRGGIGCTAGVVRIDRSALGTRAHPHHANRGLVGLAGGVPRTTPHPSGYSVIDRARAAATSLASNKASSGRSALVPDR